MLKDIKATAKITERATKLAVKQGKKVAAAPKKSTTIIEKGQQSTSTTLESKKEELSQESTIKVSLPIRQSKRGREIIPP